MQSTKQKRAHGSDNIFEAVSAITGQPFAFAAATELLAMRSLEINMSLPLRARATSLGTDLKKQRHVSSSRSERMHFMLTFGFP